LTFDTVHALTGCLLDADAHAEALGWNTPPVVLLLHHRPLPPHTARRWCEVDGAAFAPPAEQWLTHSARIPAVLTDLAARLRGTHVQPGNRLVAELGGAVERVLTPDRRTRLLAWAVLYEDVLADATALLTVRRIDAVDIDGRVYQVSRLRGDAHPLVVIDDQLDPGDTPATQPGLAALVDAARRQRTFVHEGR
jgi:hypothetical protein